MKLVRVLLLYVNCLVHLFINLSEEYFAAKLRVRRGKLWVEFVCIAEALFVVSIILSVVIKWLEETKRRLPFFSYEVYIPLVFIEIAFRNKMGRTNVPEIIIPVRLIAGKVEL